MTEVLTEDDVGIRPSHPRRIGIHVLPVTEHHDTRIRRGIIRQVAVQTHVRCHLHDPVHQRIPTHAADSRDHVVVPVGEERSDPGIEVLLTVRCGARGHAETSMAHLIRMPVDARVMVNLCPNEADPRDNVEEFVRNPEVLMMPGLRGVGLEPMMRVVEEELRKQEPESEIVILSRDVLADEGIMMPGELKDYLLKKTECGKKLNVLVMEDLPVVGWHSSLEPLRNKDAQVYCAGFSCKFVPVCTKFFEFR